VILSLLILCLKPIFSSSTDGKPDLECPPGFKVEGRLCQQLQSLKERGLSAASAIESQVPSCHLDYHSVSLLLSLPVLKWQRLILLSALLPQSVSLSLPSSACVNQE
jgi:hypothetical protein